jgi:hypothetical protein
VRFTRAELVPTDFKAYGKESFEIAGENGTPDSVLEYR